MPTLPRPAFDPDARRAERAIRMRLVRRQVDALLRRPGGGMTSSPASRKSQRTGDIAVVVALIVLLSWLLACLLGGS